MPRCRDRQSFHIKAPPDAVGPAPFDDLLLPRRTSLHAVTQPCLNLHHPPATKCCFLDSTAPPLPPSPPLPLPLPPPLGAPQRADSLGLIFPLPPANVVVLWFSLSAADFFPHRSPVADGGRFSPPLSAAALLLLHAGHTQHRSSCRALSHAAFSSIASLPGAHKRYFCVSRNKVLVFFHRAIFMVVRQKGEKSRSDTPAGDWTLLV